MMESRPKNYPKLKDYKPSRFMLPTCHYDKAKADRAVRFIENLRHTKGKWAGKRFWLLPWQEQIIRDVFGIVDERGNRQFRTAYVEIGKKNGKSELAAAVALYLLFADNEPSAEVYGAAADRQQASIVFDVANQMVQMTPALMKRCKIMAATKRIVNYSNAGFYQVLSAEVGTKHGLNVSGLVLGLFSAVIALLGLAVLVTYSPQNGIILWAIAFLISPFGLPHLAFWLLGKVQDLKFAIQDLIYG